MLMTKLYTDTYRNYRGEMHYYLIDQFFNFCATR